MTLWRVALKTASVIKGEKMKKLLIIGLLFLAACGDKVESPLEFVKTTTKNDTYDYCMKLHDNRKYCDCEIADLDKSFPWRDYMDAVDVLAGEEGHIANVIARHNGDRKKILAELNCDTCYFAVALGAVNVSPSPRCAEFLDK
jgi:hypothetical protein